MNAKWRYLGEAIFTAMVLLLTHSVAESASQPDPNIVKAAKKEGEVVVYTTTRRRVMDDLSKAFREKYGITVNFTRKSTGAIVQMVTAENMAKSIRFDVVSSGDASVIQRWLKEGILTPYKPSTASLIPDSIKKSNDYVNYCIVSMQTLVYSTKRVAPDKAPKDWNDLLNPRWKGRIAMADPRTAGGTRVLVRLMVDKLGWGYFKKLAKNEPLLVKSQASLIRLVLAGEADAAFSVAEADALLSVARGEPIKVVYPKPFTLALWLNSAVAKKAPHPNAARLWQDFSLMPEAQEIYAKHGYYTTNPQVKSHFERPTLSEIKTFTVDPIHLKKTRKKMLKTFAQIMRKAR